MRLLRDGDDFSRWYSTSYDRVLAAVALRAASRQDAAEATDEAFARAYARWRRVSKMSSPSGWTYVVAVNELKRQWRRDSRAAAAARSLDRQEDLPDPGHAAPVVLEELFLGLTPREREVATLVYLVDMSQKETAKVLGISPSTVASTLANARAELRRVLGASAGRGCGGERAAPGS